jgi:hydroxylamine dehydrogenase
MRLLTTGFMIVFTSAIFTHAAMAATRQEVAPMLPLGAETKACIACHEIYTPGIVHDWQSSMHSRMPSGLALKKPEIERRISVAVLPARYVAVVVGCFECHGQNSESHKDNFKHNGFRINVVVSPNDCRTCHEKEVVQFADSKKAHAIKNLMDNPVYHTLVDSVDGPKRIVEGRIIGEQSSDNTRNETCLGCHGTKVEVKGMKTIQTATGDMSVPDLTNWPNQGVGRENPDGTIGACTSCHSRHSFSIKVARKPYTCAQCHLEPDVPAYNVYKESKHGNLYESMEDEYDFNAVPWKAGEHFKTPTCASCHNSLVVTPDGRLVAARTHDFGARLWVRLFGLPYTHPQPISGNTTIIRNSDGLPLPTTFTGVPASGYLINGAEQAKRFAAMKSICSTCHSTPWIEGHFRKLAATIKESDAMTLAATQLLLETWDRKLEDSANPFDETIEKMWTKQWLFYGNSIRYASAMSGAPDYAAFKNGWWDLSETLTKMRDTIDFKAFMKGQGTKVSK